MKAKYDSDTRPVFGVDIDGTLGVYHPHFQWFANEYLGSPGPDHGRPYDYSMPFNKWLGISKPLYRECKLRYRRSGLKRAMLPYADADAFSSSLRRQGALVVITTTRPYNQHDGLDTDTQEWLRRNRIQFDYIIQGERKYIDLSRRFGDRVVCVFDDLKEMCEQADRKGIPAIQIAHNPIVSEARWSTSVRNFGDAFDEACSLLGRKLVTS